MKKSTELINSMKVLASDYEIRKSAYEKLSASEGCPEDLLQMVGRGVEDSLNAKIWLELHGIQTTSIN